MRLWAAREYKSGGVGGGTQTAVAESRRDAGSRCDGGGVLRDTPYTVVVRKGRGRNISRTSILNSFFCGGGIIPYRNLPRAAPTMGTGACGPAKRVLDERRFTPPHIEARPSASGARRRSLGATVTPEVAR